MDSKERFDQIESLLVSLIQKVDRQEQFNARQEQFNARQEQFNARQEQFNKGFGEQMSDVINILKMTAQATRKSEDLQEQLLREIREQGRRTDATQAEVLRLMQKWDEQDARNQAVEKRLDVADSHEPRIKRLEDDALRQAS